MIERLEIADLGPIVGVDVALGGGLVAITGESGAGKSLLLRAVEVALGGRAEPGLIRRGADRLRVRLTLRDAAGERHVVEREVRRRGRSACRVDGNECSLAHLRGLAESHLGGARQGDVYRFRDEGALGWLDRAPELQEVREHTAEAARRVFALRAEARELGPTSEVERARRAEGLRETIASIEAADVRPGEWESLTAELRRLEGVAALIQDVAAARELLRPEGEGEGVRELLVRAVQALREGTRIAPDLGGAAQEAADLLDRVQTLARDLDHYLDRLEPDPEREAAVRARLSVLGSVLRRFGPTEEEVLVARTRAQEELDHLEAGAARARVVAQALTAAEADYRAWAARLTLARREAAETLAARVREGLAALMLPQSEIAIEVETDPDAPVALQGADRVRILFAAQQATGLRPLDQVASGGEAARVLLALEGALAEAGSARTWTFDEVEAGVGGEAAWAVAEALRRLAAGRQVLVVTHQAVVAAVANVHIAVRKDVRGDGLPESVVRRLATPEDRMAELARMLSGGGAKAEEHARALLARAASQAASA